MSRRRTYPRSVLQLRRQMAEQGCEVTPQQIIDWAHRHAGLLNRMEGSAPPGGDGMWTAVSVVGYALMDDECFRAALSDVAAA